MAHQAMVEVLGMELQPGMLQVVVVLFLLQGVNPQVQLLGMGIKAMDMVVMVEVTVLILVGMGLQGDVLEVPQVAMLVVVLVVESNMEWVVATWEVAMVTQMEIRGTPMQHGDLTLHKPLGVMVVDTVLLSQGRLNISDPMV